MAFSLAQSSSVFVKLYTYRTISVSTLGCLWDDDWDSRRYLYLGLFIAVAQPFLHVSTDDTNYLEATWLSSTSDFLVQKQHICWPTNISAALLDLLTNQHICCPSGSQRPGSAALLDLLPCWICCPSGSPCASGSAALLDLLNHVHNLA